MSANRVEIYDTTLRDGIQAEKFNLSVEDKIKIAHLLDDLGVDYIEGGWPGSNAKDKEFFQRIAEENLSRARIAAFGSTHYAKTTAEKDGNLAAILEAGCPAATLVGKTWTDQAITALGVSLERNLELIHDSVAYMVPRVDQVIFDAEHFFDGFNADADYTLACLQAAVDGGAHTLVLCDTNGGQMPHRIAEVVGLVREKLGEVRLGIHTHNDSECAVASTLAAVRAGVDQVQGTINGFGERCGNANLCSIIPNLILKMDRDCLIEGGLARLTEASRLVNEMANLPSNTFQPYVGRSAFAHKGGIHVSAVEKSSHLYEHIEPHLVGNERRILLSDLSGKSNILNRMRAYNLEIDPNDPVVKQMLDQIKEQENQGYLFEAAEASFVLKVNRAMQTYQPYFKLLGFRVFDYRTPEIENPVSEASIRVKVGGEEEHTAAFGDGPVNALDLALRKALTRFYPTLEEMSLIDFKVRVLPGVEGTAARVRVLIESGDRDETWGTVGVSQDIIQASWLSLVDAAEYKLYKDGVPSRC